MTLTEASPVEDSRLLDAYEASLSDGEGRGRKPSEVYAIEMTFRPKGSRRKKSWFSIFRTKAKAKDTIEHMKKYPVADEEIRLLVGKVEWTVEE